MKRVNLLEFVNDHKRIVCYIIYVFIFFVLVCLLIGTLINYDVIEQNIIDYGEGKTFMLVWSSGLIVFMSFALLCVLSCMVVSSVQEGLKEQSIEV